MDVKRCNWTRNTDPEDDPTESDKKVVKNLECLLVDAKPSLTVECQHRYNGEISQI